MFIFALMKKIVSIFLSFVFLFSTLGISVAMDYCPMKGKYTFSFKSEKSCCCNKADDNNCCKSKKIVFEKITDNYFVSEFHYVAPTLDFSVVKHSTLIANLVSFKKENLFFTDLPPPKPSVSLSILYRSILI